MAYTEAKSVKLLIGSDFIEEQSIGDEQLQSAIEDASQQVDIDGVPFQFKERAARLYACHLLIMNAQQQNTSVEGVSSEKVGPLQTSYVRYSGDERYGDRYEAEYKKLLEQLGLGGNVGRFI